MNEESWQASIPDNEHWAPPTCGLTSPNTNFLAQIFQPVASRIRQDSPPCPNYVRTQSPGSREPLKNQKSKIKVSHGLDRGEALNINIMFGEPDPIASATRGLGGGAMTTPQNKFSDWVNMPR
jgi:hypothetical protein